MQLTSTALFAKSNLDLSNKLQQTILLDNEINGFAAEYDQLGISISVDGNLAAVGATEAKTHGVVYLFEYDGTGWHNIGYVEPSDGFYDDKFGQSVSLKGNTLVVGSYHNNYLQQNGAVYVFEWMNNQWNQIQKITTNHPNISTRYESHFGYTVNLYQDWIFVAATNDRTDYQHRP